MKLAISGTYSSGKTRTVMALAHYTGVPRTLAKTIREIMPDAVPGKKLSECTPAEFLQLVMRRHVGRAVHENMLSDNFISDGSSLQEWIYGAVRVRYGMDPSKTCQLETIPYDKLSEEMRFFEAVVKQYEWAFKQHVKSTFDSFVHLRNELPLTADGHRPMNDGFRVECDRMLLESLRELNIPFHIIGGSIEERLDKIVDLYNLPRVTSIKNAIELANQEYSAQDLRFENERIKLTA